MGSIDQDTTDRSRRIATAGPPDKTNSPGTARGQSLVAVRTSIPVEEPIRYSRSSLACSSHLVPVVGDAFA